MPRAKKSKVSARTLTDGHDNYECSLLNNRVACCIAATVQQQPDCLEEERAHIAFAIQPQRFILSANRTSGLQ